MTYDFALSKAWADLEGLAQKKKFSVRFLADTFDIDLESKSIFSQPSNVAAKPHYSVLLLHYLVQQLKGLAAIKGKWISFKELAGGQAYYATFKKRVIDVIARKYQAHPEALYKLSERFNAKKGQLADISIVLEVFAGVAVLITFWLGDEEFDSEANVLFDQSISEIFCTEDVVVLAEIVAHII